MPAAASAPVYMPWPRPVRLEALPPGKPFLPPRAGNPSRQVEERWRVVGQGSHGGVLVEELERVGYRKLRTHWRAAEEWSGGVMVTPLEETCP